MGGLTRIEELVLAMLCASGRSAKVKQARSTYRRGMVNT